MEVDLKFLVHNADARLFVGGSKRRRLGSRYAQGVGRWRERTREERRQEVGEEQGNELTAELAIQSDLARGGEVVKVGGEGGRRKAVSL